MTRNETLILRRIIIKTSFGIIPNWETPNTIGRVIRVDRGVYRVAAQETVHNASIKGNLCKSAEDYPSVGDWVEVDNLEYGARIIQVMPRKNLLYRMVAGGRKNMQVIAANIDKAYICTSLNNDFNIRRIERYAYMASMCKVSFEIILTKADLAKNQKKCLKELQASLPNVTIHKVSIFDQESVDAFEKTVPEGATITLIGSSGVGKSSLINMLSGAELETKTLRNDDQGRHTTTHREVISMGQSRVIIDTPGMRELQLYSDDDAIDETFEDIKLLSDNCKFRDCKHDKEPGCAVKEAIENETLDANRFKSYKKLQRQFRRSKIKNRSYNSN